MQKKFLTNLGLLLFLNLLVKPFWVLGIDRSVQNAVGAEDFGFYFSILNFTFLFYILLDLGITNFNNRNIAQHSQLLNKHFSSILVLKILLVFLFVIVTFTIGLIIGYDSRQFKMLSWITFNQILLSFILYLRSNISGLLLFRTDSILSVLDRLLMIIFCSILLWGNVTSTPFKIEWFVYAQTAAYAITAATAFTIVIIKASFRSLSWNRAFLIMILKKSFPFALLALLMAQYNRIDTVFLERLLPGKTGEEQAGIYAQAFRLMDAANMIAFLTAALLLPIFSRMIKLNQSIEKIAKLSFSLLFTISTIVAIGSYTYSTDFMTWLYPQHDYETAFEYTLRMGQSAAAFSLLMFGFIAISTSYVFGTLLTANGNLKIMNLIAGCGVMISIVLNVVLVPRLMSIGSAYASLSAQFTTVIAQVIAAQYIFKFRINSRFLISLMLFVAGVILIIYLGKMLPFDWKLNVLISASTAFILAILLGLINLKEFIRIIREEKA